MLPFLPPQRRGKIAPLRYVKNLIYSIPPKQVSFSALEFFYWAAMAGTSQTAMYLHSQGLSSDTVGQLSAFFAFVGIFAPPFWGMVSDKLRSVKRVFVLCMVASAVAWMSSPFVFSRFSIALVWVLFPVARFFFGPTNALLDSWLVRNVHADRRLSYGSIRLFGSIGFAVLSILYTFLIRRISVNVIFYGYALMVIPVAIIALRTRDDHQSKRALSLKEMQIGRLLKSFPFITFLLFNVALYMPVNASITFLPYLIESIGESPSVLGAVIGIKALLEIPFLLLSGKLIKKFRFSTLLVVAACGYALEMFLYPLCGSLPTVLAVQCMHGLVFGLYLSAQIQYVHSLAPQDLTATAQTLSGAASSLSGIIGNLLGGYMIRYVGIKSFYLVSGVVQVVAVTLFVLSLMHTKKMNAARQAVIASDGAVHD